MRAVFEIFTFLFLFAGLEQHAQASDFVHIPGDILQAVEDKATVRIYYEGRLALIELREH